MDFYLEYPSIVYVHNFLVTQMQMAMQSNSPVLTADDICNDPRTSLHEQEEILRPAQYPRRVSSSGACDDGQAELPPPKRFVRKEGACEPRLSPSSSKESQRCYRQILATFRSTTGKMICQEESGKSATRFCTQVEVQKVAATLIKFRPSFEGSMLMDGVELV